MQLDLLKRRAEKISGNNGNNAGFGLDDEFRLLFNESFSCSGTMTGLLLVREVLSLARNEYPEIQLWRNTGGDNYTRQTSQEIRLTNPTGDFSPDGVIQYNLNTPMSFQSGDVLGVYQPGRHDSNVRVYFDSKTSATYEFNNNPTSPINILNNLCAPPNTCTRSNGELILISPVTGENARVQLNCN